MSQTAKAPIRSSFPTVIAVLGAFFIFYILYAFLDGAITSESVSTNMDTTQERQSLAESHAAGEKLLSEYKVINAAEGKVRLPIERAKELVIAENSN
ncbi:MAG: hypothetical protein AAGB46_16225 [Verrucomicrobiota bacterium]